MAIESHRIQLELIFEAVETEDSYDIQSLTTKIEGIEILTLKDAVLFIRDCLPHMFVSMLEAGVLDQHLAQGDGEDVKILTLTND